MYYKQLLPLPQTTFMTSLEFLSTVYGTVYTVNCELHIMKVITNSHIEQSSWHFTVAGVELKNTEYSHWSSTYVI